MLTSSQNPKIKQVRSLLTQKKERYQQKTFVCEGIRLAEEAISHHQQPSLVFFSSSLSERGEKVLNACDCEKIEIAPDLLDRISDTETSQGILLLFPFLELPVPSELNFCMVLDGIQDPGNFGTILRTATAFGVQCIFYTSGTVDPYSPKVVRSAMGAHFQLPIIEADIEGISKLGKKTQLYLTDVQDGIPCWQADLQQPVSVVIGSEAFGVSPEIRAISHQNLLIPMPGDMESLNAAMSTGILLYEVSRQRTV